LQFLIYNWPIKATLAQTDSDFDSLRELPAFQALLAEFGGATANEEISE